MSFARFAAISVAVSLLSSTIAGAAGPVRSFKHGFWTGGAYTDDRTGAFTHCSAGVAYDSGINLFVLVTGEYRWWLGFINPKWSFTPNAKQPIRLRLDDGVAFDRLATIPSGQLLLVPLPDSSRLIDAFRRGSELALEAEGKSFIFRLNDTPAVMDRLTSCVKTSLALKKKAPPPLSPSAAASSTTLASSPTPVSSAASAPASGSKAGPVEAGQSAWPTPSRPASAASGPAFASGVGPPTASNPAASRTSQAQPAAAADGSRAPGPVPLQPAENTAALLSPSGESVTAAAESPSSLPAEDAPSSSEKGAPAVGFAPRSERAAQTSPATLQAKLNEPATPSAVAAARPGASAVPSPSGEPAAASSEFTATPPAATKEANAAANIDQTPSAPPPLAFTALPPTAPAPMAAVPPVRPESLGTTAVEEVRLAADFLSRARLADARLVVADKPPALSDFTAVWRSEDAAGAVKIIPPGPDVSAIGIASNLIAVDPQLCKGDFTAARFRSDVGSGVVFTAILSCSDANQQRVTEYFITPRHQGGFAVFAVIHSKSAGEAPGFDRRNIDILSRAAIEAAAHEG